MKLNFKRSVAFFDLETTGTNITSDRIIEISIVKVHPNEEKEILTKRVDPGMPIPAESSAIHGIFDEDIKGLPSFKDEAKEFHAFLEGCDLGGFNHIKFDIPVLVEEFLRAGVDFNLEGRKILDAQQIFFMMEPRTLTAAYRYYCDKELEGAHGAEADALATYEVFKSQVERYDGKVIKDHNGNDFIPVKNDMDLIHETTAKKFADFAGRIVYNDNGDECINFGKHKGKPIKQVLMEEPGYYDWMMRGDFPLYTKKVLTAVKLKSSKLMR